jgi:hypothetical protein
VSSLAREYGTTISDDGLEIYWSTLRPDKLFNGADIWRATRTTRTAPHRSRTPRA